MVITSNVPDINLSKADIFSFLFDRNDREFPDSKILFEDADEAQQSYTYESLRMKALDFGAGLRHEYGLVKGDCVALVAANHVDHSVIVFGSLACGAVVSPMNPAYTVEEMTHRLRNSDARLLIIDQDASSRALAAWKELGMSESRVLTIGDTTLGISKVRNWSSVCYKLYPRQITPLVSIDSESDVAFLVYSSGTTGLPKGVMLTHHNVTANIQQTQPFETLSWDGKKKVSGFSDAPTGDKILACLPFSHIYGLSSMLINPVYTGVHTFVAKAFNIQKWCAWVQKHRITIAYIVPPIVVQLAKDPVVSQYDLSSLRITTCGAAPLAQALVLMVHKRLGIRIKQGYGMTEAAPTLFTMRWSDWNKKSGSAGWLVPNVEAKFCSVPDEASTTSTMHELERGEVGELYVRGPNVFSGYFKNKTATANSFVDGWFKTGDVGYIDDDGDLFITDRAKELIKYKGYQIAPAELEGLLLKHEAVQDVAVVGVRLADLGTEVPRAYIVRKSDLEATKQTDIAEIAAWLEPRVASYKRLRGGIKFVQEIPKSGSGKVLRRVLKEQAQQETKSKL